MNHAGAPIPGTPLARKDTEYGTRFQGNAAQPASRPKPNQSKHTAASSSLNKRPRRWSSVDGSSCSNGADTNPTRRSRRLSTPADGHLGWAPPQQSPYSLAAHLERSRPVESLAGQTHTRHSVLDRSASSLSAGGPKCDMYNSFLGGVPSNAAIPDDSRLMMRAQKAVYMPTPMSTRSQAVHTPSTEPEISLRLGPPPSRPRTSNRDVPASLHRPTTPRPGSRASWRPHTAGTLHRGATPRPVQEWVRPSTGSERAPSQCLPSAAGVPDLRSESSDACLAVRAHTISSSSASPCPQSASQAPRTAGARRCRSASARPHSSTAQCAHGAGRPASSDGSDRSSTGCAGAGDAAGGRPGSAASALSQVLSLRDGKAEFKLWADECQWVEMDRARAAYRPQHRLGGSERKPSLKQRTLQENMARGMGTWQLALAAELPSGQMYASAYSSQFQDLQGALGYRRLDGHSARAPPEIIRALQHDLNLM